MAQSAPSVRVGPTAIKNESRRTQVCMRMLLKQIKYMITAANHGSFRAAALALRVQESAISRHIRDLEQTLGVQLFVRSSRGIRLTSAGQAFVARAQYALLQLDLAKDAANQRAEVSTGELRIGIFSSLASGFLPELFRQYRERHGGVAMHIVEGKPGDLIAAIRTHDLDIAFLTGTEQWTGCESRQYWVERVMAVLPETHPSADRKTIELRALANERFLVSEAAPGEEIHDYLVQRLAGLGRHPDIRRQAVGRDNLLHMVALGMGLTLTSEATTPMKPSGVVFVPVANETLPFSAIWSRDNDNPALLRLIELAESSGHWR